MMVLHCNVNAYVITFKVGPLGTHTLSHSILPLLETLVEGFFWNVPEFGRHIQFDVLYFSDELHRVVTLELRECLDI